MGEVVAMARVVGDTTCAVTFVDAVQTTTRELPAGTLVEVREASPSGYVRVRLAGDPAWWQWVDATWVDGYRLVDAAGRVLRRLFEEE